jgi:hypothetical protein
MIKALRAPNDDSWISWIHGNHSQAHGIWLWGIRHFLRIRSSSVDLLHACQQCNGRGTWSRGMVVLDGSCPFCSAKEVPRPKEVKVASVSSSYSFVLFDAFIIFTPSLLTYLLDA